MLPIVDFPGYYITKDGKVWSEKTKKFLKLNGDRYYFVDLYKNGIKYHKKIHRLVAEAFIPNPNNLPQINHIDENIHNNCVTNLEWCTQKKNNNYGNHNYNMKLSLLKKDLKVRCIETQKIYFSTREAAKDTGICYASIIRACNGTYKTAGKLHWEYIENFE